MIQLSEADHAKVSAAIAAAEGQSSGEIVAVATPISDPYHDVALHWAVAVLILVLAWAAWRLHPQAIRENVAILIGVFILEMVRYVFDFAKFHREASYHMLSSKLWGLVLGAATMALFAFGTSGWLFRVALILGIVCNLEGLAISMVLSQWTHDVPTLAHALRLRRSQAR